MQQHPIPQNVTQYQFRLVGDMTLKQFLELASGLVLAYLFYASNLIFIIKWPLIILSILFGAALAFFPVEDRPLDQWITNFLRAIYLPTRFIWQKTNKIPPLFIFTAHAPEVVNTVTKTIKAPAMNVSSKPLSDLSESEATKVSSLDSLFKNLPTTPPENRNTGRQDDETVAKPTISIRKLSPENAVKNVIFHAPKTEVTLPVAQAPATPQPQAPASPKVIFATPSQTITPAPQDTTKLTIPRSITLPASPKTPNIITGVVVDQNDKLVENAIVQIVSKDGIPQRAMKTNSLGQFYTSTPLSLGSYKVEIEKLGLTYSPQEITINNTILSPFELRVNVG